MAPSIQEYLSSIDGRVGHEFPVEDEMMARAGLQENWEVAEKRQLDLLAFARDFRRAFPNEAFSGIYKIDRNTGAKTKIDDTDAVLAKAFKWLDEKRTKAKTDTNWVISIIKETGLIDEYANPIIQMFRDADGESSKKEEEKSAEDVGKGESPRQPGQALKDFRHEHAQNRASEILVDDNQDRRDRNEEAETKRKGLERKKVVGSYGVILNEESAQLWKKGELVSELKTEVAGGFAALADEIDLAKTPEDLETLFNSSDAATDPFTPQPISPRVGSRVAFRIGNASASGLLQTVTGDICTVLVDGKIGNTEGVEIEIPVNKVTAMSSQCCQAAAKSGSKFCPECGTPIQGCI